MLQPCSISLCSRPGRGEGSLPGTQAACLPPESAHRDRPDRGGRLIRRILETSLDAEEGPVEALQGGPVDGRVVEQLVRDGAADVLSQAFQVCSRQHVGRTSPRAGDVCNIGTGERVAARQAVG